jgi:colicin import membrane protein
MRATSDTLGWNKETGRVATTTKRAAARPTKRTKAEVQKEFAEVRAQVEQARQEASPKLEELTKLREAETRQGVEGVSVESVVQRVSELSLNISKALGALSEQMIEEVNRLVTVREAVEIEKRELQRLHQSDVAATALDQLVQEYAQKKQELEEEITAQRTTWEEELHATERERKEQEDNLKKQRQREIEEYEYKKALERKKSQDKYEEEMRLLEKKNHEKQEALEKSWQQREEALREREEELARLRKEVQQFPERVQTEMDRVAAEATRQAEARYEQQVLVLQKDAEAEKRLAELRIKSLESAVTQQAAEIATLHKRLDEAKQQVQDIAVKAIEGASGARALSHINEIAMEQAKHRSPQS